MSYRLIDSNNSEFLKDGYITQDTANEMPFIYADLPNGMDGGMYLAIPAHEGMTNGDMIKAVFPGCEDWKATIKPATGEALDTHFVQLPNNMTINKMDESWWNAPYKKTEG